MTGAERRGAGWPAGPHAGIWSPSPFQGVPARHIRHSGDVRVIRDMVTIALPRRADTAHTPLRPRPSHPGYGRRDMVAVALPRRAVYGTYATPATSESSGIWSPSPFQGEPTRHIRWGGSPAAAAPVPRFCRRAEQKRRAARAGGTLVAGHRREHRASVCLCGIRPRYGASACVFSARHPSHWRGTTARRVRSERDA